MKIGIIDIETTGFLKDGGYIVEVGMACLDTETGNVTPLFDSLCREEGMTAKDRKAWIFENSSLTVEEVREAPMLDDIREELQSCIGSMDAVTAFNKSFDFDFLRSRNFLIESEWPCPMLVLTDILKIKKTGKAAYYGGFKWPNVEEAWEHFFEGIPYDEEHRGYDDAAHEAEIVYALLQSGGLDEELTIGENK